MIDLSKQEGGKGNRSVVAGPPSPVPQVYGEVRAIPPDQVIYTFVAIKEVTSEDVSCPEMDSDQSRVFCDFGFK